MSRTPAAEDAAAIGARLRELENERANKFKCSCPMVVDSHGQVIRSLDQACPVHGPKWEDG